MITFIALIIFPIASPGWTEIPCAVSLAAAGEICPEFFQVQKGRAVSDLFIRCEADADFPMGDPVIDQALAHGHDLCDAGLVIRAQDGGPVCGQDGLSDAVLQMGKSIRIQDPARSPQRNRASVIVLDHLRVGVGASAVVHCIQMGDQSDGFPVLISGCGGKKSVGIGMLIDKNTRHSQCFHLPGQEAGKFKFSFSRRCFFHFLAAGRIDRRIVQ